MDDQPAPKASTKYDVSLIRGGPFYRAQLATRLINSGKWNHARRVIVFAVAVAWLPLVLITVIFNRSGLASLLTDYRVYSRLLIAVPALVIGQALLEYRFRIVVQHIVDTDLLDDADRAWFDKMISRLMRLRDSLLPEFVIVLLIVVRTMTSYKRLVDVTPWLAYGIKPEIHLTAAGWYAVLVSASIFQFLLGLGLWKWLLWTIFAFGLSKLNWKLVATHPDARGGLGFLGLMPVAFAPISFAAAAAIGATWRHDILHHGAKLMSFAVPAAVLVVLVALLALGPLAFFVPRLIALRRQGILEYGILGQIHSTHFHEKWIHRRAGHEAEFLAAPESSTLADYGQACKNIAEMQPFPTDRSALIALGLSVGVPMIPVILAVVPLLVALKDLLEALR